MTSGTTPLRDLVESKIDEHWTAWSRRHPQLAKAIDRTQLIDLTVDHLRDDPAFTHVMRQASLEQHALDRASRLHQLVEDWAKRVLFG